jgi:acyl carrier protein
MKDLTKELRQLTEDEILVSLKKILYEVAPLKLVGEVTPESSLVEDFAFDSIDMMQMLLKIQERFLGDKDLPLDQFLNEAYCGPEDQPVTIKHICRLIAQYA